MRSHTGRLYAFAATLAVFFVLWAVIASRPWATPAKAAQPEADPRLVALDRLERRLKREAAVVKRTVDRRWAGYRRRLRVREGQIAEAKRRHAQELAAAAAARARIAAMQSVAAAPVRPAPQAAPRTVSAPAAPAAPQPAAPQPVQPAPAPPPVKVVTLPPQVKIVTLPAATVPATKSSSSTP